MGRQFEEDAAAARLQASSSSIEGSECVQIHRHLRRRGMVAKVGSRRWAQQVDANEGWFEHCQRHISAMAPSGAGHWSAPYSAEMSTSSIARSASKHCT